MSETYESIFWPVPEQMSTVGNKGHILKSMTSMREKAWLK